MIVSPGSDSHDILELAQNVRVCQRTTEPKTSRRPIAKGPLRLRGIFIAPSTKCGGGGVG
jgi:hypothetical protein